MNDHDPIDDETRALIERRLTAGLHALVDDEHPPPTVRDRLVDGLAGPRGTNRRWVPATAAAAVLLALVAGAIAFRDGGDDTVDLATDPAPAVTTTQLPERDVTDPAPTTTYEVLGDSVVREDPPTTTAAVGPIDPPTTQAPATTPPTTALVCQNSTDPACGAFRWDPEPNNQPASLRILTPDGPIVAGREVPLTLSMSDPDGPVTLSCWSMTLQGPTIGSGSGPCSTTNQSCPERYGPWSPPAPQPGEAATDEIVVFDEPGTYTVTASVSPADGCDNVDPYRSGATATVTVEVQPES